MTKEQEYRALLVECLTSFRILENLHPVPDGICQVKINRITAALSEPKADAQDGEAV